MKAKVKNICRTSGNRLLFKMDELEIINELEEHYTIRFLRVGEGVLTDTIKKEYVEVIEE